MDARQGRNLLAVVAAALLVGACTDDSAAPAPTTTTATSTSTTTVVGSAEGVSVTPDGQLRWDYDLVVWIEPGAAEDELAAIAAAVARADEVAAAEFFDQGAALVEFEGLFADDPELLEAVEAEDLPLSWRVRLVDCGNTQAADELSSWFEGMPGVRSVVTASTAVRVVC